MTQAKYDYIILGQGLAGTTLAWQISWRGLRVLVIDRNEPVTTSRVAAGLISPITGQRLVKSWQLDQFLPEATRFYQRVEQETDSKFFVPMKMLRLFSKEKEQQIFKKKENSEFLNLVGEYSFSTGDLANLAWFNTPLGGFEIKSAGQLKTTIYLDASREFFAGQKSFLAAEISANEDLELDVEEVRIPKLDVSARKLIFCQGYDVHSNKWFPGLPFQPAKGEILTVRIPGLKEERIINHEVWIVPQGNELFKVGSTYEWDDLDKVPTEAGKASICERLENCVQLPYEVVDHLAAVRPISFDQKPLCGLHKQFPQLGLFNGMGSKGSLQAPSLAESMLKHMEDEEPLPEEILFTRKKPGS